MFPWHTDRPGFGAQYKKDVRDHAGAFINMGAFGEVLPRYESHVSIDPDVKDRWGVPVLRFQYKFGDNEQKMAEDMAASAREMFEAAGIDVIGVDREVLTEGWSIHELGTARMGTDPKTSVLNQFQQSHDVKNLFVVDGSSHVSASCQNPTWTIMALAWRSCDYLADEFRKGEAVMSTRRELIQVTAGAVIAAAGEASAQKGGQFFTPEEFRMVDELSEIIIPADEHSPGARAAKVAAYIDARLAESLEPEPKELWRDGLKRVDALSARDAWPGVSGSRAG